MPLSRRPDWGGLEVDVDVAGTDTVRPPNTGVTVPLSRRPDWGGLEVDVDVAGT
ncbi:hypothetical protein HGO75_21705, partial [Mycobacterium tuberculosis]|nr:hypothetical protein [Mycobacterium tuberculosis]